MPFMKPLGATGAVRGCMVLLRPSPRAGGVANGAGGWRWRGGERNGCGCTAAPPGVRGGGGGGGGGLQERGAGCVRVCVVGVVGGGRAGRAVRGRGRQAAAGARARGSSGPPRGRAGARPARPSRRQPACRQRRERAGGADGGERSRGRGTGRSWVGAGWGGYASDAWRRIRRSLSDGPPRLSASAGADHAGKAHAEPAGHVGAMLGASLLLAGAVADAGVAGASTYRARGGGVGSAPAAADAPAREGAVRAERAGEGLRRATAAAGRRPERLDGAEAPRCGARPRRRTGRVPPAGAPGAVGALRARLAVRVARARARRGVVLPALPERRLGSPTSLARIEGGPSSSSVREQVCDVVAPGTADSPGASAARVALRASPL